MLKTQLLIFLVICVGDSMCVIDALYRLGQKVWELYEILDKSTLTGPDELRRIVSLQIPKNVGTKNIRYEMSKIHEQLQQIEASVNLIIINHLMKIFKTRVLLVRAIDLMETFFRAIDNDYTTLFWLLLWPDYNVDTVIDNLTSSVFPNIESNINVIRKIMTHPEELLPGETDFMGALSRAAVFESQRICNSSRPISEILIDLFKLVIIAEVKTSLISSLVNLHSYPPNEEWKMANRRFKTQFQLHFNKYISMMQQNLNITENLYIRACDPKEGAWVRNENFYEMEGLKQLTIFRYKLNSSLCRYQSCRNIWQNRANRCDAKKYDAITGCSTPEECLDLGTVRACLLKNGPYKLQYINSTEYGFFGTNNECPGDGSIIDNLNGTHAGYATCACGCYKKNNKISLSIMQSRVESNMVITGLRFIRKDNILYLQPSEGKLMANGYIREDEERWLPIPDETDGSLVEKIDKDNNIFLLDDLRLPAGCVLTGIGFMRANRGWMTGFAIEIFGVLFDYETGHLNSTFKFGVSVSIKEPRPALQFELNNPLGTKAVNHPHPSNMNYVQLQQSSLRTDVGQSMLPLFDAVGVTTNPASPLGGIGIFHKRVRGYAGFISLRAYGIGYTEYLEMFTKQFNCKSINDRKHLIMDFLKN